ncbi:hypothetical protein [Parendozoicomonas sp. Alg238-R29]|uniref:hypothetical protein n=1 Tax=Parendozoicomonas sp. Alg238-R29 TaxID=2993446 RepID=UPI00248EB925|nr:hypothetical protein [Parendozoicomonas sp. Alg238-R29]
MPVTPIGHRYTSAFRQNSPTYEEMISRWNDLTEKSRPQLTPQPLPDSRWKFRHVSPVLSAMPHLAGLSPVGNEIPKVWDNFQKGNKPAMASGIGRLGQYAASGIRASQTINDGLFEMFMAQDRYHQARIEEAVKMAEAEKVNSRFHWENTLTDLLKAQEYENLMLELISQLIYSNQETCSRIIANI